MINARWYKADMNDSRVHLSDCVSLHALGDCALLLDGRARLVYRVNPTTAFLWQCFAEGLTRAETAEKLAASGAIPESLAENYVLAALQQWESAGLIVGEALEASPGMPRAPGDERRSRTEVPPRLVPVVERRYRVLDTIFAIRCTDRATADLIDEALGPARISDHRIDESVTVAPENGGFGLYMGEDVHHDLARESLVPTVKAGIIYTALARDARYGVVHAAAVAEGDRVVMLPGLSGSGKSTLTAGLVSTGMSFIADDTVVLNDSGGVRPINSALCVKDGSWPHLAHAYPELAKATIFVRSDGKRVRYMGPRFAPQFDHARYSVASIIFPHYDPRGPTQLLPLEKGEALEKLLPLMFSETGDLESSHLDRAVELVGSARCFTLELCSLGEGVAAVRAAVRGVL